MCLAGSSDILNVTAPIGTCAGETSTVAGGSGGAAATPPLGLTPVAVAGVARVDAKGDGLATGLANTAAVDDGAAEVGAVTHPAAARSVAIGMEDTYRTFVRRLAGLVRNSGIEQSPTGTGESHVQVRSSRLDLYRPA
jgi:hypothetical protein